MPAAFVTGLLPARRRFATGYATSGKSVVLASAGTANIHDVLAPASTYGNASTYYRADSRTTSPLGNFTGATPAGSGLGVFDSYGHNANGTWTLFLAYFSGGDVSTLVGWGLAVSVVPEPTTWALLAFLAVAGGVGFWRRRRTTAG